MTPLAFLILAQPAASTEYVVGPSRALTAIADVPWASLEPGDIVSIEWRSAPYLEKWVLNAQGTAQNPITVRGLRGPEGQRPVIDGRDATTPAGLNFWNEERGVLKIGGSNTPSDGMPSHLIVEGLEVRSGRPPYRYRGDDGQLHDYVNNAAAIYVEKAQHLVIRDCVLHDSGNGLFIGAFDGETEDILIEGSYLHSNGNAGSAFEHNSYTAGLGVTYQFNRFGPLRSGTDGNNLKDRSAGSVIRYNWIEGGNRQLDLVDAEDSQALVTDPSYSETFVYGNVLIEPDDQGNSQIVHYGGDSGTTADYRKGTLYFFHNTVVSTKTGNTTLFRLSTNDESVLALGNVFYVTETGSRLALLDSSGLADFEGNWIKSGWRDSHGSVAGEVDAAGWIEGDSPGFVNLVDQDFALSDDSAAKDAGGPLPASLFDHELDWQYVPHQTPTLRELDGAPDLGAFERCESTCGLLFLDGFESGDSSAW